MRGRRNERHRGRLLACLTLALLTAGAGCGETDLFNKQQSETLNQRVDEMNVAWEKLRIEGNKCTNATYNPCFSDAIEASEINQAAGNLRAQLLQLRSSVGPSECRDLLDLLALKLANLARKVSSLASFAARSDATDVTAAAHKVRETWDSAVETELKLDKAC